MMLRTPVACPRPRQRGVALVVGLVILVVLALLGASAYSVATQDERLAGNARDHARAMDAAETMLRDCEHYVQNTAPAFDGTVPGMFGPPPSGATWRADAPATWAQPTYTWTATYTQGLNKEWSQPPQCVVEEFPLGSQVIAPAGLPGQPAAMKVAHVTARGYGLNTNTAVTLVSYVAFY